MPTVTLEYNVKVSGETALKRLSDDEAKVLERLKKSVEATTLVYSKGAGVTREFVAGLNPYAVAASQVAKASEQVAKAQSSIAVAARDAGVSIRDTHQAMGAMAMLMGSASPTFAYAAMELGKFSGSLVGLPTLTKGLGVGVMAAAAAVAYFGRQAAEVDKVAAAFTRVERAARMYDVGALRSGALSVTEELAQHQRRLSTAGGTFLELPDMLTRLVLGLPGKQEELLGLLGKHREELRKITPLEENRASAQYAASMADVRARQRQASVAGAPGVVSPEALEGIAEQLRQDVRDWAAAQQKLLDAERVLAEAAAKARGTFEIDQGGIAGDYARGRSRIIVETVSRISGTSDWLEQSKQTMSGRTEQQRAFGVQVAAEREQSALAILKADVAARESRTQGLNAWVKQVAPGAAGFLEMDAAGRRRILAEEQRLRLAAIDETLQKQLWAIEQLKVAEVDKASYVGSVYEGAETARQAAIADTLTKERELEQSIRQHLSAAAQTAGQAITANVGGAFAQAMAAAEALAASLSVEMGGGYVSGGAGVPGSALQALQKSGSGLASWWEGTERSLALERIRVIEERWGITIPESQKRTYLDLQLKGGVGQSALENEWARAGREWQEQQWKSQQAADVGYWWGVGVVPSSGATVDTFAAGGIVPGTTGAPRPAVVHEREMVLTADDQRALLGMIRGGGGSGGMLVVQVQLDGRTLAGAARVPLQQAIAAGQVQVRAR